MTKKIFITLFFLLFSLKTFAYTQDEQVTGLTNLGAAPASNDEVIIYDTSTSTLKAVTEANLFDGHDELDELDDVGSATQTSGNLLISDGTDFQSITMSGDITITGQGVTAIGGAKENDTKCVHISRSTGILATDDKYSVIVNKTAGDWNLSSVWCESDQTVVMNFTVDDGTPSAVNTTTFSCTSGEVYDTSLDGDTVLGTLEEMDFIIDSVSGTPTWCSACITFERQ